jgi:[acyl-carrier-protein] S-malonyltransferase
MSIALIFPGQGSQAIGMAASLAENSQAVRTCFEQASDALSYDVWKLTQEGPIEQLSQTEFTQPALLTAGYAAWLVWQEQGGEKPTLMAGHSLGEYTALVCAGAISFEEGVALVRDRGRYMQQAVPEGEGAMAAILGLEQDQVEQVCQQAAQGDVLQAVNLNAPGQIVIAGHAAAIERGCLAAKEAGAKRAMPLPVSIPAHSSLMSSASDRLSERLDQCTISMPEIPVIHNYNVQVSTSTEEIANSLVKQLDSPVRWIESVEAMANNGVDHFIESGPGKVLGGMVKRIAKGTQCSEIGSFDSIQTVVESLKA